jgi:hypothetical protein
VEYTYYPMGELHQEVPDPGPVQFGLKTSNPVWSELTVELGMLEAYELLSNFELKNMWQKGVSELKFEKGRVNRVGTKHICVFDKGKAEFESVTNDFGENNLVYGEKLLTFPFARELTNYFILEPWEKGTKIRAEIHYRRLPVIGWILEPMIRSSLKKILRQFTEQFPKQSNEIELA